MANLDRVLARAWSDYLVADGVSRDVADFVMGLGPYPGPVPDRKSIGACPRDTNGDGNCGSRWCPFCGERPVHLRDACKMVMEDREVMNRYPGGIDSAHILKEIREKLGSDAFPLASWIDVHDEMDVLYGKPGVR